MESQQSQAWFEIAQRVDALLATPGARERFRERVREAAAEWLRRFDTTRQREEKRSEALKRLGVPHGSGRLPPDPRDGSFCLLDFVPDPRAAAGRSPLGAWLPAELSPDLDPDDSPPLPVPAKREVSLAERYAVLAAVWDARWKGDEKIDPWGEGDYCREANWYWPLVHAGDPSISPAGLSNQDAAIVASWVADVEADLASGKPAAVGMPLVADKAKLVKTRKATVAARMIDLIKDPATHTWTARKCATRLHCSPSSVVATAAWKELVVAREMARLQASERAYKKGLDVRVDKRCRPKRSSPR